jgi:hypothetical protein
MTTTPRDYSHLQLPYTVANWQLGFALVELRPYWAQIPPKVEKEFDAAYKDGTDWVVTKADLDALPDALWDILKSHLG